jgi:DNA-binding LacI/PurR family transcriptional regulator
MAREDLARCAFEALDQLRQGKISSASKPMRVETRLVLRQSTDSPREAIEALRGNRR